MVNTRKKIAVVPKKNEPPKSKTKKHSKKKPAKPRKTHNHVCPECNMVLATKYNVKRYLLLHREAIKRYVCELCFSVTTYANRTNLRIHMQRAHKTVLENNAQIVIVSERKQYPFRMNMEFKKSENQQSKVEEADEFDDHQGDDHQGNTRQGDDKKDENQHDEVEQDE